MKTTDQHTADSNIENNITTENTGANTVKSSPIGEPKITRKELKKILREDSNWSLKSITITALTGVSVAIISTQLTGLVSSMVLIAVMAFITASVSELYRIFIALTGLGAKKAAAIVLPLQDEEEAKIAHNVEPEKLKEELEDAKQTSSGGKPDPVTAAIKVVSNAYKLNTEQKSEDPGIFRKLLYHFKNYTIANPFLLLVVLFLGIAISTVAATYIISDGEPPQIIEKTMVKQERLSTTDRSEIVQEAKAAALEELRTEISGSSAQTINTVDPAELSSIQEKLATLELELEGVDRAVSTPTPTPPPSESRDILDRVKELEKEKAFLEDRIAKLEAELNEKPSSTASPVEPSESSEATPSEAVPETKNQLQ